MLCEAYKTMIITLINWMLINHKISKPLEHSAEEKAEHNEGVSPEKEDHNQYQCISLQYENDIIFGSHDLTWVNNLKRTNNDRVNTIIIMIT